MTTFRRCRVAVCAALGLALILSALPAVASAPSAKNSGPIVHNDKGAVLGGRGN
jgi:hypothetical protein